MRRVEVPELGDNAVLCDAALLYRRLEYLRHELVATFRGLKGGESDVNRIPSTC